MTGCAGTELARSANLQAEGSAFTTGLYEGYIDLAKSEFNEADYTDSDVFAIRARAAAGGDIQAPEEITARQLPADSAPLLVAARADLVDALNSGGRQLLPTEAARAQVAFDCWMQEQEENFQPDDIAACRADFEAALAALKAGPAPAPVAAAAPAAPQPAPRPSPRPRVFTVLFGFDDTGLSAGAEQTLVDAIDYAKGLQGATISVSGYTDRAGNRPYNARLAAVRADVVSAAMRTKGVAPDQIVIASFGEDDPAVQTDDGVREVRNRRVRVVVLP